MDIKFCPLKLVIVKTGDKNILVDYAHLARIMTFYTGKGITN